MYKIMCMQTYLKVRINWSSAIIVEASTNGSSVSVARGVASNISVKKRTFQ